MLLSESGLTSISQEYVRVHDWLGGIKMIRFDKPFTQQEPIPEAGIERAVEILRSGRIHRYNLTLMS